MRTRPGIGGFLLLMLMSKPSPAVAADTEAKQAANGVLKALIAENKTPGIQYLFVDPENILFQFYGGFADVKQKIPVTDSTTFNVYSVTKTFTAAAVVKLALEGKIDLDAPIARYLNDFPYKQSPTVRQTLNHTAGFPNPNPMRWIHKAEDYSSFDEQAFIHKVIHKYHELDFQPGEKFSYSNIGYLLLGEVVSNVSGKTYEHYVQTEIIRLLSLENDNTIAFRIDNPQNHARGYIRRWNWLNLVLGWFIDRHEYLDPPVEGWVAFHPLLVNGKAYGGLVGNAGGFAVYLQAMLAGKEPFNGKMRQTLWTVGSTRSGEATPSGLGWFHGELNGLRYFAHSGGAGGYYCEIRVYPDANKASVILTNNTGISKQNYLDRIDRFFLKGNNSP